MQAVSPEMAGNQSSEVFQGVVGIQGPCQRTVESDSQREIIMLSHFSDEQLQAELERRKATMKPSQVTVPNFESLRELCQGYIDDLDKTGFIDEDHSNYIFEAAMTAFFGQDVWKWINAKR